MLDLDEYEVSIKSDNVEEKKQMKAYEGMVFWGSIYFLGQTHIDPFICVAMFTNNDSGPASAMI